MGVGEEGANIDLNCPKPDGLMPVALDFADTKER